MKEKKDDADLDLFSDQEKRLMEKIFDFIHKLVDFFEADNNPSPVTATSNFKAERQLAEIMAEAIDTLPDYVNVAKCLATAIKVQFWDSNHAIVTIDKKDVNKRYSRSTIERLFVSKLNENLENVRAKYICDIEALKYDVQCKCIEACNQSSNVDYFNKICGELSGSYYTYLAKVGHFLFSVSVSECVETEYAFDLQVSIDPSVPIATALS